ncbi:MAG: LacI family DNA-binding transcriptional regulator [Armatimonadota bacterium]
MATIRDVARESGVSVTTVSTVLNNAPRPVNDATRAKVLDVARRLHYVPTASAIRLVKGKSQVIGMAFPNVETSLVTNYNAAKVLAGVLSVAAEEGYVVQLNPQPWAGGAAGVSQVRATGVDGVLLLWPSRTSDQTDELAKSGIPVVVIAASANSSSTLATSVDVENIHGGRLAAEHLIHLGHRKAIYVAGALGQESVHHRYQGFCDVFEEQNLPKPEMIGFSFDPTTVDQTTDEHFRQCKDATAYFATNDSLALSIIRIAADHGLHTPKDISVVGFDDAPFAQHTSPMLTSFVVNMDTIAETAMRQLIRLISGQSVEKVSMPPKLVLRESTAAVRSVAEPQIPQ